MSQAAYLDEPANSVTRSTEVRWFIPGQGPQLEQDRARTVVDNYYCDLLADGVSVKVRHLENPGVFLKIRTAVHPRIAIGDVEGAPETWLRIKPQRPLSNTDGDWLEVRKQIVRRKGIEVAHVEIGDEVWWSLALRMRGTASPRLPREIATHLRQHCADAICCSYPIWLLSERGHSDANVA